MKSSQTFRSIAKWRSRFAVWLAAGMALGCTGHVLAAPGNLAECRGQLIDTGSGKERSFSALAPDLGQARIVLFGENHGVKAHSAASACVLSALAAGGRPTALVMEMLSVSDNEAIAAYRTENPERAAGLGAALSWWKRGWPAFDNWLPVVDRAFGVRARLVGGDLAADDDTPRDLDSNEIDGLSAQLGQHYVAVKTVWTDAMRRAHCNLVAEPEAVRLGLHQMRRDLSISRAAISELSQQASESKQASVLIHAGRGHTRKDRALYLSLSQGPHGSGIDASQIVTIAAFGSNETITASDREAYDYIWVTGMTTRSGDPCAAIGKADAPAGAPETEEKEVR